MLENACDVQFTNIKLLLSVAFKVQTVFKLLLPKCAKVSALTLLIASEGPAGPPAQKVNATWRDCEPPWGCWDGHMARQICQGGPGDTRLGAVLGDTQLSPGISSRCHLSDESTANGIVSPLCVYGRPLPLPATLLFVSGSSGKHIHATMLLVKCIVGSKRVLSWIEE